MAQFGVVAIYKVTKPERATLLLRLNEQKNWVIGEFLAGNNHPIRKETLWKIGAYLARRQSTKNAQEQFAKVEC